LVGREYERGSAEARDDVRHGVGLPRAGHAEQRLEREPVLQALDELRDRLGLVPSRREELVEAKRAPREGHEPLLLRRTDERRCLGHSEERCRRTGATARFSLILPPPAPPHASRRR